MPTIDCSEKDCKFHGKRDGICIARRIGIKDGQCISYEPIVKELMAAEFRPNCHKGSRGYKSSHITLIR